MCRAKSSASQWLYIEGNIYKTGVVRVATKIETVESIWAQLPDLEAMSQATVDAGLKGWEELVIACLEAGMLAPMVPTSKPMDMRLVTAAPFLKCGLDDLRATWLLIHRGYTAQAASVAASLFENALVAAVIAGSIDLANQARKSKDGEIPWGAKELCQLDAKREMAISKVNGKPYTQKMYEDDWTISYFHYKWLCQVKHPTWQAATHALKSTLVNEKEFAVRPGPNNLDDDLQVKARVIAVALIKSLQAIKSFFLTLDGHEGSAEYSTFEDKVNQVHFGIAELIKLQYGKSSPIQVLNRGFIKTDFATLKERFGE